MELGDFIDTLEGNVLPGVNAADKVALTEISKFLTEVAKAKFGVYQPAIGPFKAWKELSPATRATRLRAGFTEDQPLFRTGETQASVSYEVSDTEAVIGSTKQEMIYHELGTRTEPPRPVFGPTAFQSKKKITEIIGRTIVSAIMNSDNKVKPLPNLSHYDMETM